LHLVSLHSIVHTSHVFGGMRFRVSNLSVTVTVHSVVLVKDAMLGPQMPQMCPIKSPYLT
jgi:hypothetical protein